jgi:MFS family permease
MLVAAGVNFAICAGIWLTVRDHPAEKGYAGFTDDAVAADTKSRNQIISGTIEVLRYPNTWLLFIIPGGIVGCVLTFGGLWGVPYLSTHHGLSTAQAAGLNSAMLVAWAVGGPIFGGISDRIGRRKPLYIVGCMLAVIGWAIILFLPNLPLLLLVIVLLIAGFTSGCMIISFVFAKESVPAHLSGTVNGVINMGIMLGPTLLQPVVGLMLDRNWSGDVVNGIRTYTISAYHTGFTFIILWVVLSFILLFFTRETYCRQQR